MTTASRPGAESVPAQAVARGRFVWYDLITNDVPAAKAFYTKLAGWGIQEFDMGPDGKYDMWTVGETPIGGVTQPQGDAAAMPTHWMAYVSVPSVDETLQLVESLGGRVVTPAMDIPDVGRFAVIADPQGAVIAVFTPTRPPSTDDFTPKVGEISWHELMTSDHEAALEFYSQVFGWEKLSEHDIGAMGKYVLFGHKGDRPADAPPAPPYGGMFTTTPDMPMPPAWVYYIRVPVADDAAEMIQSLGGQVMNGPMEVPGGDRIAQGMDPQGGMFAVHSKAT